MEKVDLQAVEKNIRVAWYVSKGYYELEGFQISWWEASANRTANSISLRPVRAPRTCLFIFYIVSLRITVNTQVPANRPVAGYGLLRRCAGKF